MIVAIRTACSEAIGFGHLRRCMTLAGAIDDAEVVFVLAADARGRALMSGFAVEDVAGDEPAATLAAVARLGAHALVCDDYALGPDALAALHAQVPRLLAIDDGPQGAVGPYRLDVDGVLNASPHAATLPYALPADCLRLFGPSYALLRPEFRDVPARAVRAKIERVLVTLGGSNPGGRTETVVRRLLAALPGLIVDVVVGPLYAGELPVDERVVVHRSPRDMAALMIRADLAIAAGGQTTYELAACGVPTVAICVAENQRENLAALAAVPTLVVASDADVVDHVHALAEPAARRRLATAGQALVDGRGAERVWRALAARWEIA